jgi:hypothetical protein
MNDFATEIIELSNAASASPEMSYKPIYINADKRQPDITKTTIKYLQVGGPTAADKIGNALGAIFKVEFVDLSLLSATHIKIWGVHNSDASAVVYPVAYLILNPILDLVLDKFEFASDIAGTPAAAGGAFVILGHRKNTQPFI